ncbi:MAG: acetate--CoA ligase family protein [Pseudomonadota bacterium]
MSNVLAPRLSIAEIMNPRSVAVIGGSEDLRKFGARVLNNTIQGGFPGRIVPVNPKRETVFGLTAVPKVSALDEPVDVAVIAVPRALVLDQLRDCADSGVGCCVLITAGFTETGDDGARVQEEINSVARAAGMRLIGPNCLGLTNTHAKLIMNSSPSMELTAHEPGGIGFISQSGALMATVYNRGVCDGARFSSTISVGNQADLELADFMEWMADDPATRVVTLYVEGFKDPGRFVAAAKRCRDAGKPVLMVKAGRSEEGARVAMSHTASLAGSWRVLQAVCRDAGVIPVDDTVAMMQTAEMFSRHGAPMGDGILVMSGSGGAAAITSDLFADRGLRLAAFSAQTRTALEEIYEPVQLGNPLDIGATRAKDFVIVDDSGLSVAAADPDVSANLLVIATAPQLTKSTEILAKSGKASGKPTVVVFVPGNASDEGRHIVRDMGVLGYETIDEALRVLQGWMTPTAAGPEPVRPDDLPQGDPFAGIADGMVDEHTVKQVLSRYGVPVTREAPGESLEDAMTAAEAIGFPVALKGFGPDLIHKSDEGAVALNLADRAALETAWQAMTKGLGARLDGFLVAEMANGIEEVILGIKHDDQFGPMVLVGLGGVLAEIIDDVVLLPAPVAPENVKALMKGLRLWPVFDGARGRPQLDVDAIADATARLSWLAVDAGERLKELDINPLFVRASGQGVTAVDARARLAG